MERIKRQRGGQGPVAVDSPGAGAEVGGGVSVGSSDHVEDRGLAGGHRPGRDSGRREPAKQTFSVTNDANRVVECNLLVNSHTRTYLKVHPGKTYRDDFFPKTLVQLACVRGVEGVYGPLKLGVDYRFVSREGNRVAVVADGEE